MFRSTTYIIYYNYFINNDICYITCIGVDEISEPNKKLENVSVLIYVCVCLFTFNLWAHSANCEIGHFQGIRTWQREPITSMHASQFQAFPPRIRRPISFNHQFIYTLFYLFHFHFNLEYTQNQIYWPQLNCMWCLFFNLFFKIIRQPTKKKKNETPKIFN